MFMLCASRCNGVGGIVLKMWMRSLSSGTRTPERNGLMLSKRSCGDQREVGANELLFRET
jgi:hypothetical protein